jgi:putative transposase
LTTRQELVNPWPELSIRKQCELLGISRSGYYYESCPESAENLALMRRLDELHLERPVYGSRRLTVMLQREGQAVIALIALRASLLLPALILAKETGRSAQCLSQMRQIGLAVRLYAEDNDDEFPRSQHSAFAHGQPAWGRAIAPQLGQFGAAWTNLLHGLYHCPADRRTGPWSYGLNVYLELGPDDDYTGQPQTWRRWSRIPRPAATILFAESASSADHIMPHFWMGLADATDVDALRHRRKSN